MPRALTRAQAEAVMKIVDARYGAWYADLPADSPDRPQLIENWKPWYREGGEPVPYAIIWESGPYNWAYHFSMGGYSEEVQEATGKAVIEEPAPAVDGVYVECGTSFVLCLYPGNH